jgi:hypothetical protein
VKKLSKIPRSVFVNGREAIVEIVRWRQDNMVGKEKRPVGIGVADRRIGLERLEQREVEWRAR